MTGPPANDVVGARGRGEPVSKRRSRTWRAVQILLAVAIVAVSFLYAIPKIANYSEVWT